MLDLALSLSLKMSGLYLCIAMGFFAVRKLEVSSQPVTKLLFYLIVPLMFLDGISRAQIQSQYLLLPIFIFCIACSLCLAHFAIAKRVFHDKSANILAFTSGNGNLGYFGIPVATLLFEPSIVGLYMMMIIGTMLYESTLGYYITTKGDFSTAEAFKKMLRLPMLHGALIGLIMSLSGISLPHFTDSFFTAIRGAYSTLGMMVVGMALAGITTLKLDWKFIGMAFTVKFIAWPLLIGGLIMLDRHSLQLFDETIYAVAMLLSLMPLAVNSVIFATLLNAEPEKMASAIFLSTVFALIYVPLMVSWLIL